ENTELKSAAFSVLSVPPWWDEAREAIPSYVQLRYEAGNEGAPDARGAAAMADLAAGLAERGNRLGAALWRWRPLPALAEALAAEGDRRILWLPVFFGTGIALYFTPTFEPPWWLGLAATIAA